MEMRKFDLHLTGTAALLMHNSRLSNPLDPAAKALKAATSKRTKTDEDHEAVAKAEFIGGLYYEPNVGPYVPGDNIWRCLQDAAKKSKRGTAVKEGLLITSDINAISYKGPREAEALWEDLNFRLIASVKVTTSRIMRTRPMFREWSLVAEGCYDETILDFAEIQGFADLAGQIIGLGDWRPRYGRFDAVVKEI